MYAHTYPNTLYNTPVYLEIARVQMSYCTDSETKYGTTTNHLPPDQMGEVLKTGKSVSWLVAREVRSL